MFKPGDKVVRMGASNCYVMRGNIYTVENFWAGDKRIKLEGIEDYYDGNLFCLVKKKELLTEVDYLDAFQENFKKGV